MGNAPGTPRREGEQEPPEDADRRELNREPDEIAAERARKQQDSEGVNPAPTQRE